MTKFFSVFVSPNPSCGISDPSQFFFSPDISFPFSSVHLNAFFFQTRDAQLYNILLRSAIYFYTNIMSTLAIYGDMLDMFPIKKSLFKGQIGAICYIRVKFSARYFV